MTESTKLGAAPAPGSRGSIEIEDLDPGGMGIGAWPTPPEPWSVRVAGPVPGERVRVEIEHVSAGRRAATGRLIAIERPHRARRSPPCPRHPDRGGACGGCPLMMVELEAQRELKREHVRRQFGLEVDEVVGEAGLGYRLSSKRVFGGRAGELELGSFRPRSHTVTSMHGCLVDHPRIVECFAELAELASALGIEPYDERARTGDLRYAWAKCDGERVLLTLVTASAHSRAATELPAGLREPAGVAWSVQSAAGNAIRGGPARTLRGLGSLRMRIGSVDVAIGPMGFLQPNPAVAARAYDDLLCDPDRRPHRGRLALDLYAGAGVVTHRLRERFETVRACEAYPESAAALGVEPLDVTAFLARADDDDATPELVVANPPRAGMGPDVCDMLSRLGAAHLTIMSCSARSLVRDLAALDSTYVVERVRGYDTLPQTSHLELVAWLQRRPDSRS